MATFKETVRKPRNDGFYSVYIRIVHNRKPGYIKTSKIVDAAHITAGGNIVDPVVNGYCVMLIRKYTERLNRVDCSQWSVREVIEYLQKADEDVCFSDYTRSYIDRMQKEGHGRNACNYKLALQHLERFVGTERICFGQLTTTLLTQWIDSLAQTARAKEQYPTCLRQVFKKAMIELNDEEHDMVRIKFDPWTKIQIPKSDTTVKRAISAEACREFFSRPLPQSKMASPLPELGRDVAMLSLCLAGINTVDLFELKKADYHDGIIGYKRSKTRHSRKDEAYIEMRVEPYIQATFDKYLADENDEYLFNFHSRYRNYDSFNANVNIGIRTICYDMGMTKENKYCFYTFRHTWATIAQNDCNANLYEVAFGMNHSQGLNVTRGYVKVDFSPAWELNAKVIDFIFYSNKKSKQGKAVDIEAPKEKNFRISQKMLINGRAYLKGEQLAEVTDIGFHTVDDVISRLVTLLPEGIAKGYMVQFRIRNCDSQREVVYERSKGKGF